MPYYGPAVALQSIGNVAGDFFKANLEREKGIPDLEAKYAQMGHQERGENLQNAMLPMTIEKQNAEMQRLKSQAVEDEARANYLQGQASLVEPHRQYLEAQTEGQRAHSDFYRAHGQYYNTLGELKDAELQDKQAMAARIQAAQQRVAREVGPINSLEAVQKALQIYHDEAALDKNSGSMFSGLMKGFGATVPKTDAHRFNMLAQQKQAGQMLGPEDEAFYNMYAQQQRQKGQLLNARITHLGAMDDYHRQRLSQLGKDMERRDKNAQAYVWQTYNTARMAAQREAGMLLSGPLGQNIDKFTGNPAEKRALLQYYIDDAIYRYMAVLPPHIRQQFGVNAPVRTPIVDKLEGTAPDQAGALKQAMQFIWTKAWGLAGVKPSMPGMGESSGVPALPPRDPAAWLVEPDDEGDDE